MSNDVGNYDTRQEAEETARRVVMALAEVGYSTTGRVDRWGGSWHAGIDNPEGHIPPEMARRAFALATNNPNINVNHSKNTHGEVVT